MYSLYLRLCPTAVRLSSILIGYLCNVNSYFSFFSYRPPSNITTTNIYTLQAPIAEPTTFVSIANTLALRLALKALALTAWVRLNGLVLKSFTLPTPLGI